MVKKVAKSALFWASTAAVSPLIVACKVHHRLTGYAFEDYAMLMALVPGRLGRELRNAFYHHTLRRCGYNLKVNFGSYFNSPETEVGEHFNCGAYCIIGPCKIGDYVMLASKTSVMDGLHQHDFSDINAPMLEQRGHTEEVVLGDDVWVGEGARVAASIGRKSIVGMGSVVVREIPEEVIAVGNPARVIRRRTGGKTPAPDAEKPAGDGQTEAPAKTASAQGESPAPG